MSDDRVLIDTQAAQVEILQSTGYLPHTIIAPGRTFNYLAERAGLTDWSPLDPDLVYIARRHADGHFTFEVLSNE